MHWVQLKIPRDGVHVLICISVKDARLRAVIFFRIFKSAQAPDLFVVIVWVACSAQVANASKLEGFMLPFPIATKLSKSSNVVTGKPSAQLKSMSPICIAFALHICAPKEHESERCSLEGAVAAYPKFRRSYEPLIRKPNDVAWFPVDGKIYIEI